LTNLDQKQSWWTRKYFIWSKQNTLLAVNSSGNTFNNHNNSNWRKQNKSKQNKTSKWRNQSKSRLLVLETQLKSRFASWRVDLRRDLAPMCHVWPPNSKVKKLKQKQTFGLGNTAELDHVNPENTMMITLKKFQSEFDEKYSIFE
jgi:hypothetical protein